MNNAVTWLWIILLIGIHTADMLLTTTFIGNNYDSETFLPMAFCIKTMGIYNACWISRIFMYLYVFVCLLFAQYKGCRMLLATITILYWTAMIPWLFSLGYFSWEWLPSRSSLVPLPAPIHSVLPPYPEAGE